MTGRPPAYHDVREDDARRLSWERPRSGDCWSGVRAAERVRTPPAEEARHGVADRAGEKAHEPWEHRQLVVRLVQQHRHGQGGQRVRQEHHGRARMQAVITGHRVGGCVRCTVPAGPGRRQDLVEDELHGAGRGHHHRERTPPPRPGQRPEEGGAGRGRQQQPGDRLSGRHMVSDAGQAHARQCEHTRPSAPHTPPSARRAARRRTEGLRHAGPIIHDREARGCPNLRISPY